MKTHLKSALLFLLVLFLFTSCRSYKVEHYSRNELDKVSPDVAKYNVYIHDKNYTYQVGKPELSPAGVKGDLNPIMDSATRAEIKHPRTRSQLKKHQHDLNIFTKAEIKESAAGLVLKKADITDVSHMSTKVNIGEDIGAGIILALGVAVIVGVVYSFQGLL